MASQFLKRTLTASLGARILQFIERGSVREELPAVKQVVPPPSPTIQPASNGDTFMAEIAHLSPAERNAAIRQREWYVRLAERQGIVDAERRSDLYLTTGDKRYL